MHDSILDAPPPAAKAIPFARQIDALITGDSAARVKRIAAGSEEAGDLSGFIKKFRLAIDTQVSKIRAATFRDFVVEQGTIITASGHILVVVTVTRT